VVTGYSIGKTTEDLSPVMIQRRETKQTAFVWAIALDGSAAKIEAVAVTDDFGKPLPLSKVTLVKIATGQKHFSILVNPDETPFSGKTIGSRVRSHGRFSVE
jgi:hypothetical protein